MRLTLTPFAAARALEAELRGRFDRLIVDPAEYRRRAIEECHAFPEGDLLPFVFPVVGYTNDALAHPARLPAAREKVATLIELALPSVVARVRPPGGRLEAITDYGREGVYLGQFALALGCHRLIGGDDRHGAVHARLADVLHEALVAADGGQLWSFPHVTWPFDTLPCLLALRLYDAHRGSARSAGAIAGHLDWVQEHATDPVLGLPYSKLPNGHDGERIAPRGCDLGYRVFLLSHLDAVCARRTYAAFRRHFWIDRGFLAGFAEWPHGQELGADADSGPVEFGLGLAATGFGIGAALCMRDGWRLGRLLMELATARSIFSTLGPRVKDRYPFDERYVTGSLMGDASIFAVTGWAPWGLDGSSIRSRPETAFRGSPPARSAG
jgi:hypothetical protein